MSNIKLHISKLYNKYPYFLKMLLIYSTFTIITILVSFLIIFNYSSKNLEKEIYASNEKQLQQLQFFTDKYLVERIYSIINENFIDLSRTNNLSEFFSYNTKLTPEFSVSIYQDIAKIVSVNEFIKSIHLYRKSDDTLVSSKEGVNYNILNGTSFYKNIIDLDLLRNISNNKKQRFWITSEENGTNTSDNPTLSFCQMMPLYANAQNRVGFMVFNIDYNIFFGSLNKIYRDKQSSNMIIDINGKLLVNSTNIGERNISEIKDLALSKDTGSMSLKINNEYTLICWEKSSSNDWTYISLTPVKVLSQQITLTRQILLFILFLIVLLSITFLYFITLKLYKPIKVLINTTKDTLGLEPNEENEFKFISTAISSISTTIDEMEITLKKSMPAIQYKMAMDIIYGQLEQDDYLSQRLKTAQANFQLKYYAIVLTEINLEDFFLLSYEKREYLTTKTIDFIHNIFPEKILSICHPYNCIVTIINFDDYNDVQILTNAIKKDFIFKNNICISKAQDDIHKLAISYNEVKKYSSYQYIYGYGNILTDEIIKSHEESQVHFNSDNAINFKQLFSTQKLEQLKISIKETFQIENIRYIPLSEIQTELLKIINIIFKTLQEQNIKFEILDKEEILAQFECITTLQDSILWIFEILDKYADSINIRKITMNNDFVEKVKVYINNNIEKQLSLNIIAEEFIISPSHLSHIFKDECNENFSNYLLNIKLEKAAYLLISDKNAKISEIAERLGYLTMPYFSNLFKEKYGMTPVAYRKSQIYK